MQDETRDRLIELINDARDFRTGQELSERIADYLLANGVMALDTGVISHKKRPLITHFAGMPMDDVLDLVRAKQEGRIIALPCKVGDTVYAVSLNTETNIVAVHRGYIGSIDIRSTGNYLFICHEGFDDEPYFTNICGKFEDFGKFIFLTKEEAERALKERENNGC